MVKLPEFIGNSSRGGAKINFLKGDFGKAVLNEYNKLVQTVYNNVEALNVLHYNIIDDVVEGSNPFAVVLVNDIVRQANLRVATIIDLVGANTVHMYLNPFMGLELRGKTEDVALVLRSGENKNKYLAQDILKQIGTKIKFPIMIPLKELELLYNPQSEYNLSFKLRNNEKVFHTPILDKIGSYNLNYINRKTGLPLRLDGGEYHMRVDYIGLSRLYLDYVQDLFSTPNLVLSPENSRLVIVKRYYN